tara:strand:- start:4720 stop:5679 length:960 start_codon:yes stop_codon:yes gene_type:complete
MVEENKNTKQKSKIKNRLHRRNRHKIKYNFPRLIEQTPELEKFVSVNKYGKETINFFSAEAVKILNQSLLKFNYGIKNWDIPSGYLCPPVPGRADYIHHIADLLASDDNKRIPKGPIIHALDIGMGANCIYPIIGHCEYDWDFVGSDIDLISINSAQEIIKNNRLSVNIRYQENINHFFRGIINPNEIFDITVCNPPFHASQAEAISANMKKIKNLKGEKPKKPNLSFGGMRNEIWCEGGELRFIKNMIKESKQFKKNVLWFTSLVSKHGNLKNIYLALRKIEAFDVKTIPMGQGNKSSRIVAWTYHNSHERKKWVRER